MSSLPTILIIDDELRSLESLERNLSDDFDIKTASTIAQAEAALEQDWVKIILCDQRMPEMTGVEFLIKVRESWPDVIRIIISGYTDADDIITGINEAGIYQYIIKPWRPDNLIMVLRNAVHLYDLQRQNELLAVELRMSLTQAEKTVHERQKTVRDQFQGQAGIIRADDSPINDICDTLHRLAGFDISVLITGESGTGKELAAKAIHYSSLRWNKPFVAENCAAFPDELLESELFGHKRGAFTGAAENHMGLFERADGGTIFLDEIGEVSEAFQVKLLRVLQEGEIRPVGSNKKRQVDVRIIAATNKDLEEEVQAGRFRKDLFFRLAAVSVHMPALRERKMDIPVLAEYLLDQIMKRLGKNVAGYTREALECMMAYQWPGNVRELQNEIQRMLVMNAGKSELGADLLSSRVLLAAPPEEVQEIKALTNQADTLKDKVELLEVRILRETLIRHRWNKSKAAKELGLSRVGLRGKLERYGLGDTKQLETNRI